MLFGRARKVTLLVLTVATLTACVVSCFPTPYYRFQTSGTETGLPGVWSIDLSLYCGNFVSDARFWSTGEEAPAPGWGWYEVWDDTDLGWAFEHWQNAHPGWTRVSGIAFGPFYTQRPKLAIRAPMWLPLAITLLLLVGRKDFFCFRAEQRQLRGLCQSCGYSLTGNVSGTCPECGETYPIDPKNRDRTTPATTVNPGPPPDEL